ncbi:MAG: DNA-3-methyladenine glycosylase I [Methylotenera sp.]|jgi:DNA-3-methyladenine glycosylase I
MTNRCEWANGSSAETQYHDEEWGVPLHDDRLLFEFLILEGAQAGLSWSTILNKRANYRKAFDNFDIQKVACYSSTKIEELLQDKGIVRNKLKINATVNNAQRVLEIQAEYGSFDAYIWSFVEGSPIKNQWQRHADIPSNTPMSDQMSKSLKQKGFKFIGTTICYAFMQATGMVNDHVISCFRHSEC